MSRAPEITLGVPIYRGAEFLRETLESIQAQTWREFQAILSLDGPDPECEEICAPFLADERFRMVVQPERRGWVGNINWLMREVDTPFWCYYQQDDLTAPNYLQSLLEVAWKNPQAAVVYCDMMAFGTQTWKVAQPSVTGDAATRQLALLFSHHSAVAFRGVTRVEALRESGGILPNEMKHFSADTTWMSGVARWGELIRVPGDWYFKRYHHENTHVKWAHWPAEIRVAAWLVHCADMLDHAMKVPATPQERRLLWLATVNRLVSPRTAASYVDIASLTETKKNEMLVSFLQYLREQRAMPLPDWLESSWENLAIWTAAFLGR